MHFIQTYLPNAYELGLTGDAGWLTAILNTLYMTIVPFVIGGGVGLVFGLLLVLMGPEGVIENKVVCWIIDKVTSVFRAIPFVILIAVLAPLTMLLMQTNLGATAALVPLSFATFPFFARQVQVVFSELDRGVIEAAQASGATFWDIVKVYLSEGFPDLIRVSTVTLISLVGETAMEQSELGDLGMLLFLTAIIVLIMMSLGLQLYLFFCLFLQSNLLEIR